ncbi:hypothetical protein [Aurantibacter sp.]|uniref:hypothetical protein n=1 Tax=Aurantibacter sp. TaxID=2807103 RepID=UPI003263A33B
MNDTSIYIIILQVIILIAIYVFRNSVPTFLKEKAKNIATKQDIGKITSEIESVKSEFNKDLEILKSNLSLKKQASFSIQENKRILIYELVETFNTWLYSIVNFSFSGYNIQNIGEIKTHRKNLEKHKLDFNVIENKLNIFYNNKEFDELKKNLTIETLKMQYLLDQAISEYELKLYEKHHLEIEDYYERTLAQNNIQTEIFEITGKYYKEMTELYKKTNSLNLEFTRYLKNELEKDILK